jgi:hypothetical protein
LSKEEVQLEADTLLRQTGCVVQLDVMKVLKHRKVDVRNKLARLRA